MADNFALVPRVDDPDYCAAVLDVAQRFGSEVVIPTIDPEISVYADNVESFRREGVDVWVSSPRVAQLGFDKWELYNWLVDNRFPTMTTVELREVRSVSWVGDVIAKPRNGSSSIGVRYMDSIEEVHNLGLPADYIVQPRVSGVEVTVDFAVDGRGQCLGIIPRRRLEVRSGEVSKGVTVYSEEIVELVEAVASRLPGAYGVLNLQLFFDPQSQQMQIIEINPRFGGGYPLTHLAGGDLISAMLNSRHDAPARVTDWTPGTVMLRYDESVVFVDDLFQARPWQ